MSKKDQLRDILHAVWVNGRFGNQGMSVDQAMNAIGELSRPAPKPQPITNSDITVEPQIRPGMGAF